MIDLASLVFGPLVVPECRRSAGRDWLILVRTLAGSAIAVTALAFLWWWWFSAQFDPTFLPYSAVRSGLHTLLFMTLTIVLVLTPAVLAGSLAGEKERGSLALLLTTRVNSVEIVMGRLAGKLFQVGIIVGAGAPPLVLLGALAGLRAPAMLMAFALPAAVALGGGGLALGASAVARRGRDALLSVYFLLLLLNLAPLAVGGPGRWGWVALFNPFMGVEPLAWTDDPGPALITSALWTALGLAGLAVAAWRVRPACLGLLVGETPRGRRSGRRRRVPPLGDREPMRWKELYIERAGSLGRFGRWIGLLIVLLLIGGSTGLAGLVGYYRWVVPDAGMDAYHATLLGRWFADTSPWLSALIELAIGLRAAVAIASERERGTWDALLTSPLDGRQIVAGKLLGSLKSLRWLVVAAVWAWGLAALVGAMTPRDLAETLAATAAAGVFMAAVGVRTSLATSTATRAMAITSGLWLGALAALSVVAALLLMIGMLALMVAFSVAVNFGLAPATGMGAWIIRYWSDGWAIVIPLLYAVVAAIVIVECRLRFDRIAGRMAGGEVAVAVDQWLHGPPLPPVPLGPVALGAASHPPDPIATSPISS